MVLTAAGQTLGTLEYMSPEQLQGKKLDGRSDIYALGMVAYEMLTGNLPFEGDTPAELIRGHLKQLPRPVSEAAPDLGIPKAMDRIIARMLAKDREQRYADVRELRKELQDHIGNVTDPRRVLPTPATADVKQSKVRLWMLLGCVAVVAAGVAGGLLYFFG
jgi:serine/threonine-protein kinase